MSSFLAAQAGMPVVGSVVAGKYRMQALLGEGGMGVVFAATHELTGRRVALKWLRPQLSQDESAVRRFLREARVAGGIEHPNVIAVHDVGFEQGSAFIVMEYLDGESLRALIARDKPLSPATTARILLPAMRGVAAAHANGVMHRDLKPDNIFLCKDAAGAISGVKVLDFGISKFVVEDPFNPGLTQSGTLVGTPHYMAPEQVRGLKDLDLRIDIYAFGIVLYEALSGQVPYRGDNYGALALEIGTGTAPPLRSLQPSLSVEVERFVAKAMARDREQRFTSMTELITGLEALERADFGSPEVNSPRGTPMRNAAAEPVRRGPWLAIAAVLLLGGLVAWWLLGHAAMKDTTAAPTAPAERSTPKPHVVAPAPAPAPAPASAPVPASGAPSPPAGSDQPAAPAAREPTRLSRSGARPPATRQPRPRPAAAQPAVPSSEASQRERSTRTNAKVSIDDF